MPSAPQKRVCAKGKSAETQSTTVLFKADAFLLNSRTEVAHVGVSMLGKMFKILRLPAKLSSVTFSRFALASSKFGDAWPLLGNFPPIVIGLPFKVTAFVMIDFLC
jgi:hypothetical protein